MLKNSTSAPLLPNGLLGEGMGSLDVLVTCEESQAITIELRKLGHNAFSNDIQKSSGGYSEWHLQGDCFDFLSRNWDLIIAHPTCTYLTNSGVCWLYNKDGSRNVERWLKLIDAMKFFNKIKSIIIKIGKGMLENPIPHKWARDGFEWEGEWIEGIGRPTQIVQPYMFGHMERKATCFWLVGLPELQPTKNVFEEMKKLPKNEQQRLHYLPPSKDRAKLRSKTYPGIAKAIAMQWGGNAFA